MSVRTGKKGDLGDRECGMAVDARWAGLSISQADYLQGFPHATLSRIYRGGPRRWTIVRQQ